MKYISFVMILMLCTGCIRHYSTYRYDNGEDYVQEGIIRIVNDDNGKIGYATAEGVIIIEPQYAFGYPFANGRAKVTYSGMQKTVADSQGEYHYWQSDEWFYIDKQGNKIEE